MALPRGLFFAELDMKHCIPAFFLLLLTACSTATEQEQSSSNTGSVTDAEAKRLYQLKCSLCHGDDGKRMLAGAPDLSKSRLDLNERIALITYGKGTMPPQKDVLSSNEIKAVANYIATFRP